MGIASILGIVTQMLPLIQGITGVLDSKKKSGISEVLDTISAITPNVQELINRIEEIKGATEDDYPEVWANVRDDWNDAVSRWNAAQATD